MPAAVLPKQSDIFDSNWGNCAYCNGIADAPPIITKQKFTLNPRWPDVITRYIYNCKTHASDAARDFRAHLHTIGCVLQADVLADPLFDLITGDTAIVVERDNRTYFDNRGWTIKSSPWTNDDEVLVQKNTESPIVWTIAVVFNDSINSNVLSKNIPVSDLMLAIPSTKHHLVESFIERLDKGFYKQEYDAHVALNRS